MVRTYSITEWDNARREFFENHESLIERYSSKRRMTRIPVLINGKEFRFSPGPHNDLQKAIIEEFASRFAPGCECIYIGDSEDRDIVRNDAELKRLGVEVTDHDKMPDVILYRRDKDWIYFIEAVHSVGPMSQKRINEIQGMLSEPSHGLIFVTAFADKKTYKKFVDELAWETEVWIAADPDHMIHLNGDRFIGPHDRCDSLVVRSQDIERCCRRDEQRL